MFTAHTIPSLPNVNVFVGSCVCVCVLPESILKFRNESENFYTKSIDANGKSDYGIDTANCRSNDTKINNWIIKTQSSHE